VELMLIIIGEMVIRSLELLKRRCSRPGAPSLRLPVIFSYSLYFKNLSLYIPPGNTPGSHFLPCFKLQNGQMRRIETFALFLHNAHTTLQPLDGSTSWLYLELPMPRWPSAFIPRAIMSSSSMFLKSILFSIPHWGILLARWSPSL
jgi:hypothetical protein